MRTYGHYVGLDIKQYYVSTVFVDQSIDTCLLVALKLISTGYEGISNQVVTH